MSFSFCSIASGSSGNCYVVKSEKTTLVGGCGHKAAKRYLKGWKRTGRSPST
jgi:flavorubredoxin